MSDKKFELTRRNALIGLGTVGVASAGAGMGTSAYFSDQEEFTDNTIQAGTLDLEMEGQVVWTNRDDNFDEYIPEVGSGTSVTTDEDDEKYDADDVLIEFEDAKPGDCYIVQTDEIISGNPAYLQMSLEAAGETGLAEWLTVELYYGGSLGSEEEDVDKDDLKDEVGSIAQTVENQTLADAVEGLAKVDGDGSDPDDHQAIGQHRTAVSDDFVPGEPNGLPNDPLVLEPGRYRKFWLICFPTGQTDVNDAQGEKVEFNIVGEVEQARHNDNPFGSGE